MLETLLPKDWKEKLSSPEITETLSTLSEFLKKEREQFKTFPPENEIFRALELTPFQEVRVVILGQDPYHGEGQGNGLAFSVREGVKIPPSLKNIFKELHADLGIPIATSGELESWAKQGVLLLNTSLTVREKSAASHAKKGWSIISDAIIDALNQREHPLVFILWGAHARKKSKRISDLHYIIESSHPSPLSAHTGFWGSKPFSKTNHTLQEIGLQEIDWQLPK